MTWENFNKIPPQKQNTIISAAFTCFGKNGYTKTAMSEIAKEAGISKAALFHYFNTKKELYLFLTQHSCEVMTAQLKSGTDDFFESIEIGINAKLAVMEQYPGMYDFLLAFAREEDIQLVTEVMEFNSDIITSGKDLSLTHVDWERLKSNITKEEACNLVTWVSDGYIKSFVGKKSKDEMIAALRKYYELLKQAIYKDKYQ